MLLVVIPMLVIGILELSYVSEWLRKLHSFCSNTDGLELCLKPVHGWAGSVGKEITVFSGSPNSSKPYRVYLVIDVSRQPWYRVEDAAAYLRSLGYDVDVKDLSNLTIQVGIVIKKLVWNGYVTLTLRNGSKIVVPNIREEPYRVLDERVLILGVSRDGKLYALKLRGNKIVGATVIELVPINVSIERKVIESSCISLREFVERFHVNRSVEELRRLGVPEKLCSESVYVIARNAYVFRNPSIAIITVPEINKVINVSKILTDYVPCTTLYREASILSGAAKAVAKATVWIFNDMVQYVRDESYCEISWWAWFLGWWSNTECDHVAFAIQPDLKGAYVECYGKFYHIPWGFMGDVVFCGSASVLANISNGELETHPCSSVCKSGSELYGDCPQVRDLPCRQACNPCYGCATLLGSSRTR